MPNYRMKYVILFFEGNLQQFIGYVILVTNRSFMIGVDERRVIAMFCNTILSRKTFFFS